TRQQAALQALRDGPLPAAAAPADHASLRRLAGRGLIELTEHEAGRRPRRVPVGAASADPPDLSAAQAEALKAVTDALERPPRALRDRAFLLHGVTGSGKTEVYLRAAHEALARDRGVIVLVPEIGLTPQTVTRFEARFGDTVAVLHSQLSDG